MIYRIEVIRKAKLIFDLNRVRRMQFGIFSTYVMPDQLNPSPTKNRPQSPLAAQSPPNPPAGDGEATEPILYKEYALLCLTNLGDCLVLSIPELKRQLNAAAIRREDIK